LIPPTNAKGVGAMSDWQELFSAARIHTSKTISLTINILKLSPDFPTESTYFDRDIPNSEILGV
jgi:hypothetical protein